MLHGQLLTELAEGDPVVVVRWRLHAASLRRVGIR
jgi:hypothetical protein